MINIEKETYKNNGTESIIDDIGTLWLNEKHIEKRFGYKNLPAITNKYEQMYKKCRNELVNNPKKQSNRRFLHSNLALKKIMDCRANKSCNFKRNLGFKLHDVINTKEQTVLKSIKNAFEGQDMQTQYSILATVLIFAFININLQLKLMN